MLMLITCVRRVGIAYYSESVQPWEAMPRLSVPWLYVAQNETLFVGEFGDLETVSKGEFAGHRH